MAIEALIDRYCHGWSAADAVERHAVLVSVLTPDARYSDPGTGGPLDLDRLLAYVSGVHAKWPGVRIIRTSRVDAHHGVARFLWALERSGLPTQADGEPEIQRLVEGVDFVELTSDGGRLCRVTGFFGPLAVTASQ